MAAFLLSVIAMLADVARVRKAIIELGHLPPFDVELLAQLFSNVTKIDDVSYVRYDTPPTNPIWGQFTRWEIQPAVYANKITRVQIRYAAHLLDNPEWLCFVICKELCHALEQPDGNHDVSERSIDRLVTEFSILSHQGRFDEFSMPFQTELLAEVCAFEILFPAYVRREIIVRSGVPSTERCVELASEYGVPFALAVVGFTEPYLNMVEDLIPQQ